MHSRRRFRHLAETRSPRGVFRAARSDALRLETELGFGRGFFGLIAEGWEIEDTTGKGARGPLPDEAKLVEHIVGTGEALTIDYPARRAST
jgi:hypothetical protein